MHSCKYITWYKYSAKGLDVFVCVKSSHLLLIEKLVIKIRSFYCLLAVSLEVLMRDMINCSVFFLTLLHSAFDFPSLKYLCFINKCLIVSVQLLVNHILRFF